VQDGRGADFAGMEALLPNSNAPQSTPLVWGFTLE
jgi:hypothetical protein